MADARLTLTREQILSYRRTAGALDERLAPGPESLRQAAWAGLQDSMPRAALLSIHARVEGTRPSTWEDQSLVQLWGPRYSTYVVAAQDVAVFTLGRLRDDAAGRRRAEDVARRLATVLDGRTMPYAEVGHALGVHPASLRYAAQTGTVRIRWDAAQRPVLWTVPAPEVDPRDARTELASRYLHVFGPTTPASFALWAGIKPGPGRMAFDPLAGSIVPVRTPLGDAWILAADEPAFREPPRPAAPARLLPSGDAYWLLWGADRELMVPDAGRRSELWTPRVWPGALLVAGEIVGTWRRADADVDILAWRRLTAGERDAVTAEAEALPVPDAEGRIRVRWAD